MRRQMLLLPIVLLLASPAFGQERVDPIAMGPEKIVKALSPFSRNPDSSRVARLLDEQADKTGFPSSDYDRVLVARLWRRAGQPELALAALDRVGGDSDEADLAVYEAARVLLGSGTHKPAGLKAYWSACGSGDDRVRAEIEWDLLAVSTPDEREAWPEVEPGEPTCDWLQSFWAERAQRMIMPSGERIALHFLRATRAGHMYYLAQPRFLDGMSNSYGRPAGLAIDDRGLLYVRLGQPAHDESCPELVATPPDSFPNLLGRCWVYEGPNGYQLFYLTTKDRFRTVNSFSAGPVDGNTGFGPQSWPDGDYRIQEDLGNVAEPGNQFFHKYVMNADISDREKSELVRGGARSRIARLRRSGVIPQSKEAWVRSLDALESRVYSRRVALDLRRFTSDVLEQIPDRPDIAFTADLRFETLRFLNPSAGRWYVWLLGAVPASHLQASDGSNPGSMLNVTGRFSVMTPGGMRIEQITPLSIPVKFISADAGISLRGATSAEPGPLPLSFVIEDLNAPGTGSWIQDTVNVPAVGGLPQLSDIAVAQQEGGTWTRDGETFLQVSPAHMTNPDGSIHTYFEVYGVQLGTSYEVELRLVPADDAEDIWRAEEKDLAFRLEFRSEMAGQIGRHHLRLELGDTKPGEYTLAVRIQDADTRAYSLPAITDVFVAER